MKMTKEKIKQSSLQTVLFFVILVILKFNWISDPFFEDELIYLMTHYEHATIKNFLPFSDLYLSFSGHPHGHVFLSFLIYKSGIPFIEGMRILYLVFSALFLYSAWSVSKHFFDDFKLRVLTIVMILSNALFFTQASMALPNIFECFFILVALNFHLSQQHKEKYLFLAVGLLFRESLLGPLAIFYLFDTQKKKNLKFFLVPILVIAFFFFSEWYSTDNVFNHPIALSNLEHGQFEFKISNFLNFHDRLFTLFPAFIYILFIVSFFTLKKTTAELRNKLLLSLLISLPYLLFWGASGDSQGRDFIYLLPFFIFWIVSISTQILNKKKLYYIVIVLFLIAQSIEFTIVRNKETPHIQKYFIAYEKALVFIQENENIRTNIVGDFPFLHIFKDNIYGYLKERNPIEDGKEEFVISMNRKQLPLVKEFIISPSLSEEEKIFIHKKH